MSEKLSRLKKTGEKYSVHCSLEEGLFFGFFVLLSITKGLGFYEGQKVFELLTLLAFICGAAKIAITPYTRRQWVMQSILLLLVAVTFFCSRERGILFLGFLVLGMKDISVKKVFHVGLWVWSVCAIVLSIFNFGRLEHTVYRVHAKLGLGHIFRWSLGFTHPNILHITYLALCALLLYELGQNYKFRHFLLLMAGNVLVFLYSISYTGFGIVALLLVGGLYVRLRPRFWYFEKLLAGLVLPLCLFLSFACPLMLFEPHVTRMIQKLNFMLNTRIWLALQFLQPEYVSLFGKDISGIVQSSMTMDNSYIWGFINYGIIPFCVLMIGYFILVIYTAHTQKTRELVILACFLAAGFTEPLLFNTSFKNITLIFLGAMLFGWKEEKTQAATEYSLLPALQKRMIDIPYAGLPDILWKQMKETLRGNAKRMVLFVLGGALAGAIFCGVLHREPEGYVIPRFYTDGLELTSVYLESEDDPAYKDYVVMNYVDADTPMQVVNGQAVRLETVRYYTGSILIGGLAGFAAGVFSLRQRKGRAR